MRSRHGLFLPAEIAARTHCQQSHAILTRVSLQQLPLMSASSIKLSVLSVTATAGDGEIPEAGCDHVQLLYSD